MEGRGFESNSTSSSSSGEEPNASCPSPVLDLKSNLSAVNNSSIKKSGGRRSVQKRVVSVPIAEVDGSRPRGSGEGAPPSDSWTWRKYGQKPIKGSPYPRGYYRCSSSKGCPARKQVERSRLDPTMLLITYASDHNHPWPLPKSHHHTKHPHKPQQTTTTTTTTPPTTLPTTSPEDTFSSDLPHDSPLMLSDHFWHPYVPDTSLTMMPPVTFDDVGKDLAGAGGEEDALFEGLGELPECSVVFRRAEESRRCSLMASSWCGSSG